MWARLIERARFDPVWFAREVLRLKALPGEATLDEPFPHRLDSWEMDAWQVELLEAVADVVRHQYGKPTVVNHEGKTVISCRALQGPGKTFGLALVMHWFGFCFPGVIPCTAPKLEHLKTRLWKEFRKIQHRAVPGYAQFMEVTATRITWAKDPDWFATAETASQPEAMQGLRGKYTLVGVDEASGVNEPVFPVVFGSLAATKIGILVMIGNPTRNIGTFADTHRKADKQRDVYLMHIGPSNTRRVPQSWIDKMVRMYGENSPAVRIRCYGEFAESDRDQLISHTWIADAFVRPPIDDGSVGKLRVSVDVADGGEDDSVVTVAKHFATGVRFIKQRKFNFPPALAPLLTAQAAETMFIEYGGDPKVDDFVVDSLGVGAGTCGWLIQKGYRVVRYTGGSESSNPKRWRNRRVQSYIVMRDAFRDGRCSIDADAELEDGTRQGFVDHEELIELEAQLCSVRRKAGTERLEDLQTREEMRQSGIKSPDRADSMAMQYATQAPVVPQQAGDESGRMRVITSTVLDGLVP